MKERIVFAFVGADRPGLVDRISQVVEDHAGNWRGSRLTRLAGEFAGVVELDVAPDRAAALARALEGLTVLGLQVVCRRSEAEAPAPLPRLRTLHVLGPDRRGIVHEVAHALGDREISVTEMTSSVFPAPMSGEPTFSAEAVVAVPGGVDLTQLLEALDEISRRLTVEIDLGAEGEERGHA